MGERLYPLTFEPEFRDYIWGGRRLETLYGRRLPLGIVAESWEISGHPSAPTRVANGRWRGTALPDLVAALGLDLVGRRSAAMLRRGRFPLLIKLLDANRDLSVQVHPDDAYAAAHEGGELGKTEMWYVLHAEPGAELILGLARGVTRVSFEAALRHGALETQLHRVAIAPGDVVFVPAGTVHALLAGAVVAEVQQNSDTTYRVYDWGRLGADGVPRPLHVERALQVIDWQQVDPGKQTPVPLGAPEGVRRSLLVSCDAFVAERVDLGPGAAFQGCCDGSTFEVWGCMQGSCALTATGDMVEAVAVRFVLLPAALGAYTVQSQGGSTLLRVVLPG